MCEPTPWFPDGSTRSRPIPTGSPIERKARKPATSRIRSARSLSPPSSRQCEDRNEFCRPGSHPRRWGRLRSPTETLDRARTRRLAQDTITTIPGRFHVSTDLRSGRRLAWAHLTTRRHSAYPHVCYVGRVQAFAVTVGACLPSGDGSCRDSRLSHALLGRAQQRPLRRRLRYPDPRLDSRQRDVDL